MSITVRKFISDFIEENTYLITDEATGLSAVIDPGYYGDDVEKAIGSADNLKFIILTHGHGDHIRSIYRYVDAHPEVKIVAHQNEKEMLADAILNGSAHMPEVETMSIKADIFVTEKDLITLGESEIRFIATPGHTPGGMCILVDDMIFSGDTLFFMSVGATHFAGGSWADLKDSIVNRLFALPDNTVVYPGHGPETSIGYEKRANPFV